MLKLFRIGVIVVALVPIGGGVAAAEPNIGNVIAYKDSADGWRLIVKIDNITIQSVPNLAATPTTREGYVTATATAKIERTKPEPIDCPEDTQPEVSEATCLTSGNLALAAVTGCQWGAQDGLEINPQFNLVNPGAATTFAPGAPVNPIQTQFFVLPQGEQENSNLQWTVKPGLNDPNDMGIIAFSPTSEPPSMTKDEQKGGLTRVISVQEKLVRKEGCGGPVAVRLEAMVKTRTSQYSTALAAYSDIVPL